ncbi:hypothetical protein, partial [Streptomyces sp. NPDC004976]
LDVAQGLTRLVHSELEDFGTREDQRLDEEEIADTLRSLKAVLRRLGITFNPPFRDFRSFHGYWSRNDMGGSWAARRGYLSELFTPVWEKLDELEAAGDGPTALRGVDGEMKNIIFASTGLKPEIILRDAINNVIEVAKHGDKCLVYNRALTGDGLEWGELVDWWRKENGLESPDKEIAKSLYERLKLSLDSEPEKRLFYAYCRRYGTESGSKQPALLPQVYLHYDPLTKKQRNTLGNPRRLRRERMDFLLMAPGGVRIVIEVDGQQHYSRDKQLTPDSKPVRVAAPDLYSEMVAEDRALRLKGYEVFRFGGYEIMESRDLSLLYNFFDDLEARYWGNAPS